MGFIMWDLGEYRLDLRPRVWEPLETGRPAEAEERGDADAKDCVPTVSRKAAKPGETAAWTRRAGAVKPAR